MIEYPYGIADFQSIRQQGLVYVDRTDRIRDLERLGRILIFLRPRRFGKSLWLQTLANYYDLRRAGQFDELFGGLAIGNDPTPLANRYFVLQWNFSNVDPGGSLEQIGESIRSHVRSRAAAFVSDYEEHLPSTGKLDGDPASILDSLLAAVRKTPYKLYVLIDEYDNFINQVMNHDPKAYRSLVEANGAYKLLFQSVKNATEGQGMERLFVTGVSPMALNDLTSGFNNAKNLTLDPALGSLCGFTEDEIRGLLEAIVRHRGFPPDVVEGAVDTMRTWYNGYLFSHGPPEGSMVEMKQDPVYNPTNALYFLEHLLRWGTPPKKLHDENLRADRGRMIFLGRSAAGTDVVEKLTEGDGTIDVSLMVESFSVDDLTVKMNKDPDVVASLLFYTGMLTLSAEEPGRLRVPNLVVKKLFLDRLQEIYLPDPADSFLARQVAMDFFRDRELQPLLDFFEEKLLPVFSNRDRGAKPRQPEQSGSGFNEMAVKALFLSMLFDDTHFVVHSEMEIEKHYADLCLLVRPEMRRHGFCDLLFELKLVRRQALGRKGRELASMDRATLCKLTPVKRTFDEARRQVADYRAALLRRYGADLELRSFAVVGVGLERMLGEEVTVRT